MREIDVARRLMHYAVSGSTIPKNVDDRLVTVKDPAVLTYTEDELRGAAGRASPIPTTASLPTATPSRCSNAERFVRGTNIQEIFAQLDVARADARVLPGQGAGPRQPRR